MTTNINKTIPEEQELFDGNDFVLVKDGNGNFIGGGYKIKSTFLNDDTPVMTTMNSTNQDGGKVSSPFENLAVPAGLFYVNMRVPKKEFKQFSEVEYKQHNTISDDIMDKLFSMVELDKKKKRKTRKHNPKISNTKTRKYKSN